jgi:hypothetical protein
MKTNPLNNQDIQSKKSLKNTSLKQQSAYSKALSNVDFQTKVNLHCLLPIAKNERDFKT